MRVVLFGLSLLALPALGCARDFDSANTSMSLRAFPIGDCDQDGIEDYATALLYNDYSDPHPPDAVRVFSGKSGQLIGEADLGRSGRHSSAVAWAGAGLQALGLILRSSESPPSPRRIVRMSCAGAPDFLAELPRSDIESKVVGIGLRAAKDGGGGVWVVVCSAGPQSPDSVLVVLYRWFDGKATELKRHAFKGAGLLGHLECTVGQFEGDSELDIAIGEPGRNSSSGAIHLIDGRTGEQRVLLEGTVPGGDLGLRLAVLGAKHAGEAESLVFGSTDETTPGRGRGALSCCAAAAPRERIWRVSGVSDFSDIDRDMQVLPDCDGDGVEDVGYIDDGDHSAQIISGRTGARVLSIGHAPWQWIEGLAPCADIDGDGRSDLLLSVRPGRDAQTAPDPQDRLLSGCIVVSTAGGRTLRRYSAQR